MENKKSARCKTGRPRSSLLITYSLYKNSSAISMVNQNTLFGLLKVVDYKGEIPRTNLQLLQRRKDG